MFFMKAWFNQYPLILFFALVFTITWGLWIPATLTKLNGGVSPFGPDQSLGQLGRWAPGLIAMLVTLILAGKQALKTLLWPLGIWRVAIGWYVLAIFIQPMLFLLSKWLDGLLGNTYVVESPLASLPYPIAFVIPIVILSSLPGSFAEELGWRGFALPRLQEKDNAVIASIVLALAWGVWHVPSLLYFGETQPLPILFAVINFVPVTILYTLLYNNTKGSLLLVTLLHVGQQLSNNFLGIIPTMTDDILMWVVAIFLIALYGTQLGKE
jgi:membrane protease YdiL (CAAX protease family)